MSTCQIRAWSHDAAGSWKQLTDWGTVIRNRRKLTVELHEVEVGDLALNESDEDGISDLFPITRIERNS